MLCRSRCCRMAAILPRSCQSQRGALHALQNVRRASLSREQSVSLQTARLHDSANFYGCHCRRCIPYRLASIFAQVLARLSAAPSTPKWRAEHGSASCAV